MQASELGFITHTLVGKTSVVQNDMSGQQSPNRKQHVSQKQPNEVGDEAGVPEQEFWRGFAWFLQKKSTRNALKVSRLVVTALLQVVAAVEVWAEKIHCEKRDDVD